jgi:hypothetical protein
MTEWKIPYLDEDNKNNYIEFLKFFGDLIIENEIIHTKKGINQFENQIKDITYFINELSFINSDYD